jgi:hypothetical protein
MARVNPVCHDPAGIPGHRQQRRQLRPAPELRCPRPDLLDPSPTHTPAAGQPSRSRPTGLWLSLLMLSETVGIVPYATVLDGASRSRDRNANATPTQGPLTEQKTSHRDMCGS